MENKHTPEFIESLKSRLDNEITGCCTYETDLDRCSWHEQHGVLLSCNQAIYIKKLIASDLLEENEGLRAENKLHRNFEKIVETQAIIELRAEVDRLKEENKALIEALITCSKEDDKYSYIVARCTLKNYNHPH